MFTATVRETGESFACSPEESVLAAMLRSRTGPVKTGCEGGGCGVCRMRILEGDYVKFKRMSRAHVSGEDEAEGIVLLCCVKPAGDLLLSGAPAKAR